MTLFDPADLPAPGLPAGESTVRLRMTVAYDGSAFRGFARQAGVRTVGGVLTEHLERVLSHPVELVCAGRTDAGVHGWGQVVSFDAVSTALDLDALRRSVNDLAGPEVAIRSIEVTEQTFDARHSARSRLYRYSILNSVHPDPFLARTAWHVDAELDLVSLRLACDPLVGEHDFASFCRRPKPRDGRQVSLVRRVLDAHWEVADGDVLHFWIEATSFCHQMVRSVVGTLVDVGKGRRKAGEVSAILRAADRQRASSPAPPHGLCLWDVRY